MRYVHFAVAVVFRDDNLIDDRVSGEFIFHLVDDDLGEISFNDL